MPKKDSRKTFHQLDIDALMGGGPKRERHAAFLPSTLFMLMIAPTGGGKTQTLMSLILNGYLDFQRIWIYSKTLYQPQYQLLAEHIRVAEKKTGREIGTFIEDERDLPKPADLDKKMQHLMVFDDVLNERQDGKIKSYFSQGRHNSVSVIYLSQSFFAVPRQVVRNNANMIVLFHGLNLTDIRNIWQQYSQDMSLAEFKRFYAEGAPEMYDFVSINLAVSPRERYRIGFDKPYEVRSSAAH